MLWQRLITGPLLIALILGVVWFDASLDAPLAERGLPPGLVLLVFAALLSVLIAREVTAFLRAAKLPASNGAATAAALLGLAGTAGSAITGNPVATAGLGATALSLGLLGAMLRMAWNRDPAGSLVLAGGTLLAGVYGGVLLGFWMLIRLEHSPWVLVGAVLTTKSCDIGAYFTGMTIGRHKLIPWLSPKKTWEGLAGGVVTAAAVGGALGYLAQTHGEGADRFPWWIGAVGGALVAVIGQAGDLAESAFKRDAGLKDSGRTLPGMGGVLDVLDSPLFAGPVVYWLLRVAPVA
ncbi:MAG: phosphatidate cytidylyltransferase [Planctomycetaceae bacterium]|nr:phosphatidate cytidylyltransferase [Planctomycetaceae bacterium]